MNEYILEVKDFEGEVLELKTFADNLMQVIDNMVSLKIVETIETITRTSDDYVWKYGESLVPLIEMREQIEIQIENENVIHDLFKNKEDSY